MVEAVLEYAALAFFYSLLTTVILEALLRAWQVQDPPLAVAFRLGILVVPPLSPLLFGLLNPTRSSEPFRRQAALLDLENWLGPHPDPAHPGWVLLVALMGSTMLLLMGIEAAALLRHLTAERSSARRLPDLPGRLQEALARLVARGIPTFPVVVLGRGAPMACTVGLWRPTVVVTASLVETLDDEEMEGVLAHEMAHARRRDNWLSWLIFLLRLASFYNPVALFTFHQISHDMERVCDAESAAATGKRLPLASALLKVYAPSRAPAGAGVAWSRQLTRKAVALESRARQALVVDRVERLVHPETVHPTSHAGLRLGLAVGAVLGLAYLVV